MMFNLHEAPERHRSVLNEMFQALDATAWSLNAESVKLFCENALNLADGAVPMRQWDCSHDPDILDLLKRMPRRYAGELKLLLEVLITAPPQTVVDLRRQLTG